MGISGGGIRVFICPWLVSRVYCCLKVSTYGLKNRGSEIDRINYPRPALIGSPILHPARFHSADVKVLAVCGGRIHDLSIVRANVMLPRDRASFGVTHLVLQSSKVLPSSIPIRGTYRSKSVKCRFGIDSSQLVKALFVVHNWER